MKLKQRDTRTIKHYLPMTGGDREIELSAFLSLQERVDLKHTIEDALKNLNQGKPI
ncbi:MAG: hypothetical protein JKX71_09455 [Amylibacter sp.]|nr:hypothetical protein [Amylibacter sp.]